MNLVGENEGIHIYVQFWISDGAALCMCAPPGPLGNCSLGVGPSYPIVICCSL